MARIDLIDVSKTLTDRDGTVETIAMRALGDPDAFPASDVGVINAAMPMTGTFATALQEVFAGETDGLLGILVFQYAPYEGGAGYCRGGGGEQSQSIGQSQKGGASTSRNGRSGRSRAARPARPL